MAGGYHSGNMPESSKRGSLKSVRMPARTEPIAVPRSMGLGQSVKFLAAREHIDNQLYALDLCL